MLEQRVLLWFGYIGDKAFLVALSFRNERLKYCKILENHDSVVRESTYQIVSVAPFNMSGPPPPGQQPSPQQLAAIQQQIAAEAQRRGMTPQQLQAQQRQQIQAEADKAGLTFEQYINKLKQQAFENHQRQQQMAQQQAQNQAAQPQGQPQMQGQQGQQVPITPGAPDPRAVALAKWLKGQDLKPRTCILNGQRKDMFRGTHLSFPFVHVSMESLKCSNSQTRPASHRGARV